MKRFIIKCIHNILHTFTFVKVTDMKSSSISHIFHETTMTRLSTRNFQKTRMRSLVHLQDVNLKVGHVNSYC